MISFFSWFRGDPVWTKIERFGALPNTVCDFDESKAETACRQCDCAEMDLIMLWFDAAVMPPCAKLQDVGRMAWRMARECLGGEVTEITALAPISQSIYRRCLADSAVWGCLGGVDAIWGGPDGSKPGKYAVRGPGDRVGGCGRVAEVRDVGSAWGGPGFGPVWGVAAEISRFPRGVWTDFRVSPAVFVNLVYKTLCGDN